MTLKSRRARAYLVLREKAFFLDSILWDEYWGLPEIEPSHDSHNISKPFRDSVSKLRMSSPLWPVLVAHQDSKVCQECGAISPMWIWSLMKSSTVIVRYGKSPTVASYPGLVPPLSCVGFLLKTKLGVRALRRVYNFAL